MNELVFLEEERKWEDPIKCALCERIFLWWIFYFFQRCCYCGAKGHLFGNNGCIWIDGKPLTAGDILQWKSG
jgi:hypothetical protein